MCNLAQTAGPASNCHQADQMASDHSLGVRAAVQSCGQRDLIFVLPVASENLQMKFARAHCSDALAVFNEFLTIASRRLEPGLAKDARAKQQLRDLSVRQVLYVTFPDLRI